MDGKPGNPELKDVLDNQLFDLGDDVVKTAGIGEHIVDWPLEGAVPLGEEYYQSVRLVAQRGWQLMEHSFSEPNHATRADVWERVNREFPTTNLRWSIDHVNTIEPKTLARMKALGVGIRAHGWRVLGGTAGQPAALSPAARQRHPCRHRHGRRAGRAHQPVAACLLHGHRAQRAR